MGSVLNRFLEKPVVNFFLAVITLLGFGWGIFSTFKSRDPKIQYTIQSELKLLNPSKDFLPIHLLIDTIDVLTSNKNITSYLVEIKNVGSGHSRFHDYDDTKFGVRVDKGTLLGGPLFVCSNNSYIEEKFNSFSSSVDPFLIELPHISLDKQDWYSFSFLVLHDSNVLPSLMPVGRIIGQSEITVRDASKETIWPLLLQGDRVFVLMIVAAFCIGGVFLFILSIYSMLKKSFVSISFEKWNDGSKTEDVGNKNSKRD